jgi:hypothetical protein
MNSRPRWPPVSPFADMAARAARRRAVIRSTDHGATWSSPIIGPAIEAILVTDIVIQGQGDGAVLSGRQIRHCGGVRPIEDALHGRGVVAHFGLIEAATQAGDTGCSDLLRVSEVLHHVPSTGAPPEARIIRVWAAAAWAER